MMDFRIKSLAASFVFSAFWTALYSPAFAQAEDATSAPVTEQALSSQEPLTRSDVDAWLDGFMGSALEDGKFTGAVVSVVKDGQILTSRGYGYADPASARKMDGADTLIRPGSISKLFTWTAIMQLKEQGKVDLDTDVNRYLDFKIPETYAQPVTLRHLMTHTSGFEETVKDLIIQNPSSVPKLDEYLKEHLPERIHPPGEVPAYSNYGTALAGYIVQRVSGQNFEEYIERNIFSPLSMQSSSFRQPLPAELAERMSGAFTTSDDPESRPYELIPAAPAGALASTAEDMARFMIAHLDNGAGILSPATTREMHTPSKSIFPSLNTMALGFYQQNRMGVPAIGHGGDTVYFHSDMSLFPKQNVGLFISVNSQGRSPVQSLLLREQFASAFVERYLVQPGHDAETKYEISADSQLRELEGVYEVSRASSTNFMALGRYLGQVRIDVDKSGNLKTPFLGIAAHWKPIARDVWQRVGGTQRLAVSYRDGKIHQWAYEPASPFMVYSPPPWYRSSALLNPLLSLAGLVALITVLLWPLSAFLRWRYQKSFTLTGRAAIAYRLTRVGLILTLLYLIGWIGLFFTLASNTSALDGRYDGLIRLMQISQVFLYFALATAIWNVVKTWSNDTGWINKLWALMSPLAIVIFIWFAAATGLLGFSLSY